MSSTNRSRRRVGVEERTDARGRTEYRGWVWDPDRQAQAPRRVVAQLRPGQGLAHRLAGRHRAAGTHGRRRRAPPSAPPRSGGSSAPSAARSVNRSGDIFKPSALRGYRRDIERRLLPELGPSPARPRCASATCSGSWTAGRMEGMSPSSVRNALMPLRGIYRYHAARRSG